MQSYRNNRIGVVEGCPVTDENMETYASQLFDVALRLYELVDVQGQKVFLHDVTGVSRAPTALICYIALFWKKRGMTIIDMVKDLKKAQYQYAEPNLEIISKVLTDNKSFLEKQRNLQKSEEADPNRLSEEEMRLALQRAQADLEKLRQIRLKEAEDERDKRARWQHEQDEKKEYWKREDDHRDQLMDDKLQALRDRLEHRKVEDDDWLRKLKMRIAEEEAQREAEKLRSSQEVELKQEQIRL